MIKQEKTSLNQFQEEDRLIDQTKKQSNLNNKFSSRRLSPCLKLFTCIISLLVCFGLIYLHKDLISVKNASGIDKVQNFLTNFPKPSTQTLPPNQQIPSLSPTPNPAKSSLPKIPHPKIVRKSGQSDYDWFDRQQYEQLNPRIPIVKQYLKLKNPGYQQLAKQQYNYYQQKYNISQYPQLPFCLVITTYNNFGQERYKKNLDALRMQNYSNYRAVIYNDVSTDGTGQAIQKYLTQYPDFKKKITLIHNTIRTTAMKNLRLGGTDFCSPSEIYILYDGDDELIGRQVLKVFNSFYHSTKAWFVYSTTLKTPGWIGPSRAFHPETIQKNDYRQFPEFRSQHCKTYYNQLFRLVKDEDLRDDDGDYYQYTSDQAISLPMLEMAHRRVAYVNEMLYLWNVNTGNNDGNKAAKQQQDAAVRIRKRQAYKQLDQLVIPAGYGFPQRILK